MISIISIHTHHKYIQIIQLYTNNFPQFNEITKEKIRKKEKINV